MQTAFLTFADRRRHAAELVAILDEIFAARPVDSWLEALRAAGIPCGPVNSVSQALADEHTTARGMVVETEHPRFGTVRQVRSPVRVGAEETVYRRAPARHEDATAVLTGLLGYDASRVEELGAGGAFGAPGADAVPRQSAAEAAVAAEVASSGEQRP